MPVLKVRFVDNLREMIIRVAFSIAVLYLKSKAQIGAVSLSGDDFSISDIDALQSIPLPNDETVPLKDP